MKIRSILLRCELCCVRACRVVVMKLRSNGANNKRQKACEMWVCWWNTNYRTIIESNIEAVMNRKFS